MPGPSDGLEVNTGPLDPFDPLWFVDDSDSFSRRRVVEIKPDVFLYWPFVYRCA